MHKARENANGTFSIGKTWNFEELSEIQSFTDFRPSKPEERDWAQWAGLNGFMVTLGKPYFWVANSPKEKSYFIASLIKVYERYTNGKQPHLSGFSQLELRDVLSEGEPGKSRALEVQPDAPNRGRSPFAAANGFSQRPQMSPNSSYTNQTSSSPQLHQTVSARKVGPSGPDGRNSPGLPIDSLRPAGLRQAVSREQLRSNGEQPGRLTPQSSNTDLPIRNGTPDSLTTANSRRGGAIYNGVAGSSMPREVLNSNGMGISNNQPESIRSNSDRCKLLTISCSWLR